MSARDKAESGEVVIRERGFEHKLDLIERFTVK
jgi:hypothetical protein